GIESVMDGLLIGWGFPGLVLHHCLIAERCKTSIDSLLRAKSFAYPERVAAAASSQGLSGKLPFPVLFTHFVRLNFVVIFVTERDIDIASCRTTNRLSAMYARHLIFLFCLLVINFHQNRPTLPLSH